MQPLITVVRFLPFVFFIAYIILSTWIIKKYPLGGHRSVSDHIAQSGKYFRVSAVLFSIIAIGFCANLLLWAGPHYHAIESYSILTIFFLISSFGLSWFPADMPGSKKREHILHLTSAYLVYFTIIAFSVITAFVTYNSAPLANIVSMFTLVIYVWLMTLYLFYKPSHNHFVFYETIGISTFFILFIALAIGN
jgi:hypothetical protein